MEVGLITRLEVESSKPYFVWHGIRDILRVDLIKNDHPLVVLVNHWKSRINGSVVTGDLRTVCATRAYQIYYEIARENPNADIVICGDFNDGIIAFERDAPVDHADGVVRFSARTESVRAVQEVRLEDRFNHQTDCRLADAIFDDGDA